MKHFNVGRKQKGNMLLNIAIALVITAVLAAIGIPKLLDYLVEGAVPSVAEEIQRFVGRTQVSNNGNGTAPYTGLNQTYFARAVRGSALQVGAVAGQGTGGTVVRHGLGGDAAGTIVLTNAATTFTLTFNNVSQAACPGLATSLQKTFDNITINGTAVKVTAADRTITQGYVAAGAAAQCVDGELNTFVFMAR